MHEERNKTQQSTSAPINCEKSLEKKIKKRKFNTKKITKRTKQSCGFEPTASKFELNKTSTKIERL